MKYVICLLTLVGSSLLSTNVLANLVWTERFRINQIYMSGAENYHFRVYGMDQQNQCTNGSSWAFINESSSGSKGMISLLLSAYMAGKDVRLLTQEFTSSSGNTYCKIIELEVSG